MDLAKNTLLIAAAGNNISYVTSPAAFDSVLAVGSYHFKSGAPLSKYSAVPVDRFILAPDGIRRSNEALAERSGLRQKDYMHGSSFAAAFVTGVAARIVCGLRGGPCGHGSGNLTPQALISEIGSLADKSWVGYDEAVHGQGLLRLR